jgi:hypothetical protein
MPAQYWVQGVPPFVTVDGTAYTGTTIGELTPVPRISIPAPALNEFAGKRLEFQAGGHYTTGVTAGTYTFSLLHGAVGVAVGSATAIATSAAISYVVSQTNRFWRMEGNFQIRSIGATGTCIAICEFSNMSSGGTDMMATTAGGTVAIDTTTGRDFLLSVTGSAAQSITCRYFGVRMVN